MAEFLIDNVYEMLKKKYGKKPFSFSDAWNLISKEFKLSNDNGVDIGALYVSLLEDKRFVFNNQQSLYIREFLTKDAQAKLQNTFDDSDDDDNVEGNEEKLDLGLGSEYDDDDRNNFHGTVPDSDSSDGWSNE